MTEDELPERHRIVLRFVRDNPGSGSLQVTRGLQWWPHGGRPSVPAFLDDLERGGFIRREPAVRHRQRRYVATEVRP